MLPGQQPPSCRAGLCLFTMGEPFSRCKGQAEEELEKGFLLLYKSVSPSSESSTKYGAKDTSDATGLGKWDFCAAWQSRALLSIAVHPRIMAQHQLLSMS